MTSSLGSESRTEIHELKLPLVDAISRERKGRSRIMTLTLDVGMVNFISIVADEDTIERLKR